MLEDDDFIALTAAVKEWAEGVCGGRIVSCLEGGYNLNLLGQTVRAHVAELERG
jgi:acetoin utilization deacetylase AcuC-like enzyme